MATATAEEIDRLVADLDRGRQAWIDGALETTVTTLVTQADDMLIAGPFGGGPVTADPSRQTAIAAAQFHGGTGRCELVRAYADDDLLVLVMIERNEVRFAGHATPQRWDLRTTQVFRRDGARWLRLHRHADPLLRRRSLDETLALLNPPR